MKRCTAILLSAAFLCRRLYMSGRSSLTVIVRKDAVGRRLRKSDPFRSV